MPAKTAICVEQFSTAWYGAFQALDQLRLDIPHCRVTLAIGPSGCGKSTLLRCFNRMNDLVPGARVDRRGAASTARTSTRPAWTWSMSAGGWAWCSSGPIRFPRASIDNVAYRPADAWRRGDTLDEHRRASLRAAALWDEVKDKLHSPRLALSGGQQQRLCIARALAVEPEVILMDEPARPWTRSPRAASRS